MLMAILHSEISNELESILSYNSSLTKNITSVFESMKEDIAASKKENPVTKYISCHLIFL